MTFTLKLNEQALTRWLDLHLRADYAAVIDEPVPETLLKLLEDRSGH